MRQGRTQQPDVNGRAQETDAVEVGRPRQAAEAPEVSGLATHHPPHCGRGPELAALELRQAAERLMQPCPASHKLR
jgi:hypothetical protein